jgi:hypothetical protein
MYAMQLHEFNLVILLHFCLKRCINSFDYRVVRDWYARPDSSVPEYAVGHLIWGVVLFVLRIILCGAKAVWR